MEKIVRMSDHYIEKKIRMSDHNIEKKLRMSDPYILEKKLRRVGHSNFFLH